MSVIAYRDRVICSDGRLSSGSALLSENVKKIAKGPGVIGGFCGGAEELHEYLRWVQEGAEFEKIPNGTGTGFVVFDRSVSSDDDKIELFIVDKNRYLQVPLDNKQDYYTDGSGYKVALGAFVMGASAKEAVQAAIRHETNCGGKIFTEKL